MLKNILPEFKGNLPEFKQGFPEFKSGSEFAEFGNMNTLGFGGSETYFQKVVTIFGESNIAAFYPMDELSGTTMVDKVNGINATYVSPTSFRNAGFNSTTKSVRMNGTNSYANLYSSALNTAFNKSEGALFFWLKMSNVASWTNGLEETLLYLQYNSANRFVLAKVTTGAFTIARTAGGVVDGFTAGGFNSDKWVLVGLKWSTSADQLMVYINGLPVHPIPATTLGTWTGDFASGACIFGGYGFYGNLDRYLSNLLILNTCPTDAQIRQMYPTYDQIVFCGDSRSEGKPHIYRATEYAGFTMNCRNVAVGGYKVSDLTNIAVTKVDPFIQSSKKNICLIWAGVNAELGANYVDIYNALATFCTARKAAGWTTIVCSEIDAQDANRNAINWHTIMWPGLNGLLAADHSFADYYCDLGANVNLQDANNTTYFADKVHLTVTGYEQVAQTMYPIIQAAINN